MVLLWDLSNGELVAQFKGHTDSVYTLCFSREGSLLASGKTSFITARIRRMGEGTVFSLFVSPHLGGGGVPQSGLAGGGRTPSQVRGGVPHPRSGAVPHLGGTPCLVGGTPSLPPPIAQSSIASTCYAADGVPLAFTREDFLVIFFFKMIKSAKPSAVFARRRVEKKDENKIRFK